MMNAKQNHFSTMSELIEHSQAMLTHAEAGDWEAVVKEEVIQREQIEAFFSQRNNVISEFDLSDAIQALLQINNKLEKLAIEARDSASADVNSISNGRKAVNTYADNAR